MELETIRYEVSGAVARLTLNRPKAMNAMNDQLAEDLYEAVMACDGDPSVRALIVTGEGRAFCAGGDVASFHENIDRAPSLLKNLTTPLHAAISRMARMEKPVIASINGVVAGAGMGLAAATDLAIAAESAVFTMAYTGIGATPDGSSTFFLPRLIGVRRAMELTLLNRVLTAEEALEWGLINQIAPDDKLVEETDKLAARLAKGPTRAFAGAKRLLYQSFYNSPETQMEDESQSISAMGATDDFREGVAAFVQKRKPEFKGS